MWLSLFASWLPLSFVSQFLGLLECEGFAGVLALTLASLDHHGEYFLGVDSQEELLLALLSDRLIGLNMPHQDSFSRAVAAWLPAVTASLQRPVSHLLSRKGPILLQQDKCVEGEHVLENNFDVLLDLEKSKAQAAYEKAAAAEDCFVQETASESVEHET